MLTESMKHYDSEWIRVDSNMVHCTAIVYPNVRLGTNNIIGAYCVIGSNGEIRGKDYNEFKGSVIIGNNNRISEHVTIQRPFEDGQSTMIGDNNLIMAHVHIGHDAYIGDNVEICTSSVIGGYAYIFDNVKIKLNCTIRNRVVIEPDVVIGMGSVVVKDVKEGQTVKGNPAK